MKKVLILTTALDIGGITSFMLPIVNLLKSEYDLTIAYTTDKYNKLSEITGDIELVQFEEPCKKNTALYMLAHGWMSHIIKVKFRNHNKVTPMASLQRVNYSEAMITQLPQELNKHYDVAISTAEFYCNDLVVEKIDAEKKIGWIHPDYSSLHTDTFFDKRTLDKLDYIVTVSNTSKNSLITVLPEYRNKVYFIPNLLNAEKIIQLSKDKPQEYSKISGSIFVTVARLDNSSKRLDRIVEACRILKGKGFEFHWFIVGGGSDYDAIQTLSEKMKTTDVLHLLGAKVNPYPYIKYADAFVLTSQYEGKPVVVDEAMLLGCPVVTTQYTSAIEQIGDNGQVVENNDMTAPMEIAEILLQGMCKNTENTALKKTKDKEAYVRNTLIKLME